MSEVQSATVKALARAAYDAAHPSDSFEALERRTAYSREAAGLYRDWIRAARSGALGLVEGGPREKPRAGDRRAA
jgi:hypothetical protein